MFAHPLAQWDVILLRLENVDHGSLMRRWHGICAGAHLSYHYTGYLFARHNKRGKYTEKGSLFRDLCATSEIRFQQEVISSPSILPSQKKSGLCAKE